MTRARIRVAGGGILLIVAAVLVRDHAVFARGGHRGAPSKSKKGQKSEKNGASGKSKSSSSAKSQECAGWSLAKSTKSARSAKSKGKSSKAGVCPDPSCPGPYPVGYRNPSLNSAPVSDRKGGDITALLPYAMWYPAKDGSEGPVRFELPKPFDIFNYELPGALETPNFADLVASSLGSPKAGDASCFPLVISSHGSGANSDNYHELHRQLASLGFVVAAPTHEGNSSADLINGLAQILATMKDDKDAREAIYEIMKTIENEQRSDQQESAYDRPRDASAVIDDALSGEFGSRICTDRIAVIGHSFGGFAALAVANGYDPLMDSFETYERDERVKAAVAMAPATLGYFRGDLADLEGSVVPTLVLSGTKDEQSTIVNDTNPAWEKLQCSTEETYRVDLESAGHGIYMDLCFQLAEFWPKLAEALGAEGLSADPLVQCPLLLDALPSSGDPELAALCLLVSLFALQAREAGCIPTAGFLLQKDGKPTVFNYVASFLKSTIGEDGCSYDEYLTEMYARAASLPVYDKTLFLKESVDDVCNV